MELVLLIIFPFLLGLSALFSSSETAFFSLSNFELAQLEEENPARGRRVRKLLESPDLLLNGILLGNLVVNICATAVATLLLHGYSQHLGLSEKMVYLVDVAGMTLILLIFCEISPKVYAISNASRHALRLTWFIRLWVLLSRPLVSLLVSFSTWFKSFFARSEEDREMLEEELKLMVDISAEQGDLELEEKKIIHNIFELFDTMVREIMVPRTDIKGIPIDTPLEDMVRIVKETGHSRFPVFEGELDNIKGVLYAKDLLNYIYRFHEITSVEDLLREAYYVPETKLCGDTLREFQRKHIYMGIVVDEYGGTEGLVTVEDIMEEIIGEIQDEHDEEEPLLVRRDDGSILVDGKINMQDLAESLTIEVDEEGYETLGGFVFTRFGRLPHPGENFDFKNLRFTVTKLSRRRIW
ncbi:DUF21 domain-containing protein, partial [Candidatus Peregrinibacteria bacterium]|nr:DUF21 domain-containing protein [Candidatus Peregrinibacteria bacterium]